MIKATVKVTDIEGLDAVPFEVVAAIDANLDQVATVVFEEAKNTTAFSDKTGNLRKSIRKRKSKFINGGYIVSASGTNRGNTDSENSGRKGYHAHLVEYGHVLIAWGRVTGKRVPAHPFLRPAKEKGIRKAIELFRKK